MALQIFKGGDQNNYPYTQFIQFLGGGVLFPNQGSYCPTGYKNRINTDPRYDPRLSSTHSMIYLKNKK